MSSKFDRRNYSYTSSVGHLDINAPQTAVGKKLFEWIYKANSLSDKPDDDGEKITIYMHIENGDMLFQAKSNAFDGINLIENDLNTLKDRVKSFFDLNAHALNGGVQWEDWLELVIDGGNSYFDSKANTTLGGSMHIQVNKLKRGINPTTGQPITMNKCGYIMDLPKATSIHNRITAKNYSGDSYEKEGKERAYIPDTPTNRAALESIVNRLQLLRENLADLLSQAVIEKQLESIDRLTALPKLD